MTAQRGDFDRLPTLRDQLADVALHHQRPGIGVCGCGGMGLGESYPLHLADALLPVVERAKAEAAAEALETAARWLTGTNVRGEGLAPDTASDGLSWRRDVRTPDAAADWFEQSIRDRAASLRAVAGTC